MDSLLKSKYEVNICTFNNNIGQYVTHLNSFIMRGKILGMGYNRAKGTMCFYYSHSEILQKYRIYVCVFY